MEWFSQNWVWVLFFAAPLASRTASRSWNLHFDDTDPVKRWDYDVLVANSDSNPSRHALCCWQGGTEHAGQSRLLLTLTHTAGDLIKTMVANVLKGLYIILANAPKVD